MGAIAPTRKSKAAYGKKHLEHGAFARSRRNRPLVYENHFAVYLGLFILLLDTRYRTLAEHARAQARLYADSSLSVRARRFEYAAGPGV
jgi:hypothetical protein